MDKRIIVAVIVVLVAVLFWSPWITVEYAKKRVGDFFEEMHKGVQDGGCIFRGCGDCGIYPSEKTLFGRKVVAFYYCGEWNDIGRLNYIYRGEYFVSAIGTVHKIKEEVIEKKK